MTTIERERTVVCKCGRRFVVSARQERRIRKGEYTGKCPACVSNARLKPLEELKTPQLRAARLPVSDRDRLWWLERYTLSELVEIAAGMSGRPVSKRKISQWRRIAVEAGLEQAA